MIGGFDVFFWVFQKGRNYSGILLVRRKYGGKYKCARV